MTLPRLLMAQLNFLLLVMLARVWDGRLAVAATNALPAAPSLPQTVLSEPMITIPALMVILGVVITQTRNVAIEWASNKQQTNANAKAIGDIAGHVTALASADVKTTEQIGRLASGLDSLTTQVQQLANAQKEQAELHRTYAEKQDQRWDRLMQSLLEQQRSNSPPRVQT